MLPDEKVIVAAVLDVANTVYGPVASIAGGEGELGDDFEGEDEVLTDCPALQDAGITG